MSDAFGRPGQATSFSTATRIGPPSNQRRDASRSPARAILPVGHDLTARPIAKLCAGGFSDGQAVLTQRCTRQALGADRNVTERRLSANGVELHVLDEGEGPLVILCHGFPELAFSCRHQLPALARAGFRVVAPDMRGYGGSSAPSQIEAYDVVSPCGDLCGLLDALRSEEHTSELQ